MRCDEEIIGDSCHEILLLRFNRDLRFKPKIIDEKIILIELRWFFCVCAGEFSRIKLVPFAREKNFSLVSLC